MPVLPPSPPSMRFTPPDYPQYDNQDDIKQFKVDCEDGLVNWDYLYAYIFECREEEVDGILLTRKEVIASCCFEGEGIELDLSLIEEGMGYCVYALVGDVVIASLKDGNAENLLRVDGIRLTRTDPASETESIFDPL